MTKPDDSSLAMAELRAVEARARLSLDTAGAWGRFPTPVDDILLAAKLARFDTDRERAVQGQWHAEQLSMGDALFGPARADLCSSWTAG